MPDSIAQWAARVGERHGHFLGNLFFGWIVPLALGGAVGLAMLALFN